MNFSLRWIFPQFPFRLWFLFGERSLQPRNRDILIPILSLYESEQNPFNNFSFLLWNRFCLVNFFSVASFSSQRRSHCPHLISALSSRHSPWKWKLFTFCFVLKSDNAVPRRQRRRWEQRDKSAEEISAFNFHKRYDFVAFHISFPSTTDNFSLITKGNFKVIVIKKFHF